jgi:hypothetical protein
MVRPRSGRSLEVARALPVGNWRQLPVRILGQEQDNWCWAAVALSLALYFKRHAPPFTSQCALASSFVGNGIECCGKTGTAMHLDPTQKPGCDLPCDLKPVLARLVENVSEHFENAGDLTSFDDVAEQIDDHSPLAGHFRFDSGIDHFFIISGYLPGSTSQLVRVLDPNHAANSAVPLEELRTTLSGSPGKWFRTFRLKAMT